MLRRFGGSRIARLLPIFLLLAGHFPAQVQAQRADTDRTHEAAGAIAATVTTQGTIALAGVLVTLKQGTTDISALATDADGRVRFSQLAAGQYTLVVESQRFDTLSLDVAIAIGEPLEVALD